MSVAAIEVLSRKPLMRKRRWWWRMKARNGETIASSETCTTHAAAVATAVAVRLSFLETVGVTRVPEFVDLSEPGSSGLRGFQRAGRRP